MRAELAKMQKEYLIKMEDVVTKNEKGKVIEGPSTQEHQDRMAG